jgi:malate dehydrogenase (oxaloacetate-decarboxylating)
MAFPGIFRGALDVRASQINEEMKLAAAYAIAETLSDDEITTDYVVPDALDPRVFKNVSAAVSKAARETGVARI